MKKHLFFTILLCVGSPAWAAGVTENFNAGQRLYVAKDYQRAIRCFDAVLREDPDHAAALTGRANSLYAQKRYLKALEDYRKILALQPKNAELRQFVQALQARIDDTPRTIEWRTPEEGLAESLRTGKPILYDLMAEWCPPCRAMNKQVFGNGDCAQRINLLFVPVRAVDRRREEGKNPEAVEALQNKYQLTGFPTLVVQYPGRKEHKKIVGYGGVKRIMDFLNGTVE